MCKFMLIIGSLVLNIFRTEIEPLVSVQSFFDKRTFSGYRIEANARRRKCKVMLNVDHSVHLHIPLISVRDFHRLRVQKKLLRCWD